MRELVVDLKRMPASEKVKNHWSRGLDLECVVLLKVRIFFFLGRWEVAMLH